MLGTLIPRPVLSGVLMVVWLLAWGEMGTGIVVLGLLPALGLPHLTAPFWPEYPPVRDVRALARLLPVFLYDVVIANLKIVPLILGPLDRLRPSFVVVPLDVEHPLVISLLASMITLTPGTVSANISGDGRHLLVHTLDLDPDQTHALIHEIKSRYETPLRKVFGC